MPPNLFVGDLPIADAYVLMEIIHDWDDVDAARILSNIRRSASEHPAVLIVETVFQSAPGPDPAQTLDIAMLASPAGKSAHLSSTPGCWRRSGSSYPRSPPTAGAAAQPTGAAHPGVKTGYQRCRR